MVLIFNMLWSLHRRQSYIVSFVHTSFKVSVRVSDVLFTFYIRGQAKNFTLTVKKQQQQQQAGLLNKSK